MEIKLGESPAEFRFEVAWDSGGEQGTDWLVVNYYEVHARLRREGFVADEEQPVDESYVDLIVKVMRAVARPRELVAKLTDEQLYAKANETFHLFTQLGEGSGSLPTSQRPTGLSITKSA